MERRSMSGRDRDDDRGGRDRDRGRDDDRGDSRRGGGRGDDRDSGRDRDRDSDRGRDRGDDRGARRSSRDDDDRGGRSRDRDDRGSGSSRGYRYERRDDQAAKDRANKGSKDFDAYLIDAVKMFKVQDGANDIRILPPTWKGAEHFGYDIYVHFQVGPDSQAYLCPHKMKGDPCPICEERKLALDEGDEEYAKKLEPKRRVLYYLVDRKHMKDGVMAWAAPWTVDRDLVKVMVDRKTGEALPIDHPEEGFDVEFDKSGQKDRTKYEAVAIARRDSPLDAPEALDFAIDNPLPSILVYYDYDHIAKAFGGGGKPSNSGRSSRDDDDRGRGRDRDDRERGRDDVGRDDRGGDRSSRSSRDDDRGGRRDRDDEPDWDSLHKMTFEELEAVIDSKGLKINPDRAKSEEELADWVCEDLNIKEKRRDSDDGASSRLAEMRRNRGD